MSRRTPGLRKILGRLYPVGSYHEEVRYQLFSTWHCFYCNEPMTSVHNHRKQKTLDHIVCRVNGGRDYIMNFVASCRDCNQKRDKQDFIDFAIASHLKRRYKCISSATPISSTIT